METFSGIFKAFGSVITQILPLSPFQQYIDQFAGNIDFLEHLNWFFPIGPALKVMSAWLGVISTYYIWSAFLRWLKVIGD